MNNVVQLDAPKQGDQSFFLCGCDPQNPEPFMPIALFQDPPVVVGLLCPKCEQHLSLVNGVVQKPDGSAMPLTPISAPIKND